MAQGLRACAAVQAVATPAAAGPAAKKPKETKERLLPKDVAILSTGLMLLLLIAYTGAPLLAPPPLPPMQRFRVYDSGNCSGGRDMLPTAVHVSRRTLARLLALRPRRPVCWCRPRSVGVCGDVLRPLDRAAVEEGRWRGARVR